MEIPAIDKTKIDANYNVQWTREWKQTYANYRNLASKLNLEESTKAKDLLHALRIATKVLSEIETQREELEAEELPKYW